jgi:Fe-S-cluster containining protein
MRGPLDFVHDGALLWRLPVACPHLTAAGRCGIYKTRPDVCREFEAGGKLCKAARKYHKETSDGKA